MYAFSKCTMARVYNLSIKRLRQEDYCEFKASLDYLVGSLSYTVRSYLRNKIKQSCSKKNTEL